MTTSTKSVMLSTPEFLTIRDEIPTAELPILVLALIFSPNALTQPYLKLMLLLCLRILPQCLSLSSWLPNSRNILTFKLLSSPLIQFYLVSSGEFRLLMDLVKVGSSIRTNHSQLSNWTPTRLNGPELLKVPIFVSSTHQAVLLSLMLGTLQFSLRVMMDSALLISTSRSTKTVGSRFHQSGSMET